MNNVINLRQKREERQDVKPKPGDFYLQETVDHVRSQLQRLKTDKERADFVMVLIANLVKCVIISRWYTDPYLAVTQWVKKKAGDYEKGRFK